MNPLIAGAQPQAPMAPPQGASAQPQITPDQIAKAHGFADHMVEELTQLLAKPPGQLSKQDVFQGAASLLGKGLFNDPQARMGLVTSLTQLPDDEGELRKALGGQLLEVAGLKRRLDDHAKTMGG